MAIAWVTFIVLVGVVPVSAAQTGKEGHDLTLRQFDEELDKMTVDQRFRMIVTLMQMYPKHPDFSHLVDRTEEIAGTNHVQAQYLLGIIYRDGTGGTAKDPKKSHSWFLRVAQQDPQKLPKCWETSGSCVRASAEVGANYLYGTGVQKDQEQAFRWFLKAAEAGYPLAQFNVSMMYLSGIGVARNIDSHVSWMRRAADGGNEQAKQAIEIYRSEGLIK